MTASHLGRASVASPQVKQDVATCTPMSHQNSGDHGHEMYPQQFVRLVGCHDVPAPAQQPRDDKLH